MFDRRLRLGWRLRNRRPGRSGWFCRLDVLAPFRPRRMLRGAAGTPEHGCWLLAPEADGQATRRYRGDTLILETRFETDAGAVLVVDFMPPRRGHSQLLRLVIGERGSVAMRTELVVRFGYGAQVPWVRMHDDGTLCAIAGADQLVLRTPVPVRGENMKTLGSFTVSAGEVVPFALAYAPSHLRPPGPRTPWKLSLRRRSSGPIGPRAPMSKKANVVEP
jgi:hypothetical protein